MMNIQRHAGVAMLATAAMLAGCNADAVNKDRQSAFLTADDLVKMTDQMAASIIADTDVQRVTAQKPMIIVLKPIDNQSNEVIRTNELRMYVHRVRALLSKEPALRDRFVFVLNRDDYEALRQQEGLNEAQLGQPETRIQPEYALTGTFYANTNVDLKRRSDTYLCTFRLTNLQNSQQLWEGSYETSKHIKKEFLD
jgi:hypothetical protein